MADETTFYEILGVSQDASAFEIQDAYAQLTGRYKSDLVDHPAALHAAFETLNEAYGILMSPERRAAYDRAQGIERVPPPEKLATPQWTEPPRRTWKYESSGGPGLLRGCLFAVAGLVALGAVGGVWFSRECNQAVKDADRTTTAYFRAISEGDYRAAYDLGCESAKRSVTFDDFKTQVSAARAYFDGYVRQHRAGAELNIPSDGPRTLRYQATVDYSDGSSGMFEGLFAKEAGGWCIVDAQLLR